MKNVLASGVILAILAIPAPLRAEDGGWSFAQELTIESQWSPLGTAVFEDVPKGSARQTIFGLGFYNPRGVRPMVRNTLGAISRLPFSGRRIASTNEVEVLLTVPLPDLSATLSNNGLCPYIGWGFSLTRLEMGGRHRGYSAAVFETGMDIRPRESSGIAGFRASIHILASGEHFVIGLFLGTLLHPASIISELLE